MTRRSLGRLFFDFARNSCVISRDDTYGENYTREEKWRERRVEEDATYVINNQGIMTPPGFRNSVEYQ